ncbi:MAG: hypothetical protein RBS57_19740 [Desulforhabdus sp.]|jgi:hypothetical protein|nr:hypothetical protein [Desulforhabdus sp.]
MRKRISRHEIRGGSPSDQSWLDLQSLAQVELTSEDETHPIESAYAQFWLESGTVWGTG